MFKNKLAEFVYLRTYARYMDEYGRRENWDETCNRVVRFLSGRVSNLLDRSMALGSVGSTFLDTMSMIRSQDIMPSMRLMQFAGPAAEDNNLLLYNCSYIAPKKLQDFGDILYILMCGVGVGFSVEAVNVESLPKIKRRRSNMLVTNKTIEDSRSGWADALVCGLQHWYDGADVIFDYSQIRPAGTRLKTSGGRASGPEPLRQLLDFARNIITHRAGRRLSPTNVHDIICKIGECVVAGGVRRSALISLSDLDDKEMRDAKNGQFYLTHPYRSMANNSAVYNEKPSDVVFMREWLALMESGTGERGIFNRSPDSMSKNLPLRRRNLLKPHRLRQLGTNPCGEILLQSHQLCNLTEVICRPEDTEKTLIRKVMHASILGTLQSTFTKFPYVSEKWTKNCEEERLLGVSLSGIYDNALLGEEYMVSIEEPDNETYARVVFRRAKLLEKLKKAARRINRIYAKAFGIPQSTCVTCIKPSGTVSQVVDCASGIHPRFAKFYIRRVRCNVNDPIFHCMKAQGVPYHPEVGQTLENMTTAVLEFVVKSPDGAKTRHDLPAWQHLEDVLQFKRRYTEHNPSVTIYVDKNEWLEIAYSVHNDFDSVGGLSFLPKFDHAYQLAPYEEINEEIYTERAKIMDKIDFSRLWEYEKDDNTDMRAEGACTGGTCELN